MLKKALALVLGLGIIGGVSACTPVPQVPEPDKAFIATIKDFGLKSPEDNQLILAASKKACSSMDEAKDASTAMSDYMRHMELAGFGYADRQFIMHATLKDLCAQHREAGSQYRNRSVPGGW